MYKSWLNDLFGKACTYVLQSTLFLKIAAQEHAEPIAGGGTSSDGRGYIATPLVIVERQILTAIRICID